MNREISKINYKIHTDAIKEYLLKDLTNEQLSYKYVSEADMINVVLFNKKELNSGVKKIGTISTTLVVVAGVSAGVLGGKFDFKFPKKI